MKVNESSLAAEIATSEPALSPDPPHPSEASPAPSPAPATCSGLASELRRVETEIAEKEDSLNYLRKLHRQLKSTEKASPAPASSSLLSGWKTCLD